MKESEQKVLNLNSKKIETMFMSQNNKLPKCNVTVNEMTFKHSNTL